MSFLDDESVGVVETLTTLTLHHLKASISERVSASFLHDCRLEMTRDYLTDGLVLKLSTYVLADRVDIKTAAASTEVDVVIPDGWWQMFKSEHKATWWGRWLVRHWPIRPTTVTRHIRVEIPIEQYLTFPKATRVYPRDLGLGDVTAKVINLGTARWTDILE